MKVRYIGDNYKMSLHRGSDYEVTQVEGGWYRIVDETGEDYLFRPEQFEVVDALPRPPEFAADDPRVAVY